MGRRAWPAVQESSRSLKGQLSATHVKQARSRRRRLLRPPTPACSVRKTRSHPEGAQGRKSAGVLPASPVQTGRHAKRALLASSRSIQELASAPTVRLGRIRWRQVRPRRTRARNAPRSRPPRRGLEASPVTATAGTRGLTLGHAHRAGPANSRMPRGLVLARSVGRMPHLQKAAPSRPAASAMQVGRGQTEGHAQRVHLGRTRTMWGTPRVRRARLMQPQLPRVTRRPTARAIQGITLRQPGAHAWSVLREAIAQAGQ